MAAHILRELLLQERADKTTWFALCDRVTDRTWVCSVAGPAFPEGRRGGGWTYQRVSGGATILYEGPSREEAEDAVAAFRQEQSNAERLAQFFDWAEKYATIVTLGCGHPGCTDCGGRAIQDVPAYKPRRRGGNATPLTAQQDRAITTATGATILADGVAAGQSLQRGLSQALRGDTRPASDLWDGIDEER